MTEQQASNLRRNQEHAVRQLVLARKSHGPDPERVARETQRRLDEMERSSSRQQPDPRESIAAWVALIVGCLLVLAVTLRYADQIDGWVW